MLASALTSLFVRVCLCMGDCVCMYTFACEYVNSVSTCAGQRLTSVTLLLFSQSDLFIFEAESITEFGAHFQTPGAQLPLLSIAGVRDTYCHVWFFS